ncbi:Ppx/GppA family phosphatase [Delftia sp. PS-11]|uniref:Ppx/GppA family phosphatase n=1 Tax=Delftia sp. PS-11 TaxID=2767222 RepID=UPI002455FA52|nr:Ppx/GppA family phosphatase [Delftia sp. PS-11]KAJ8744362.1 Ppx/GppA family phosphatase [Delftia sp. PS-11]
MPSPFPTENRLAAIDIGSNSCLLAMARLEDGKVHLFNNRKEAIRLGSALDASGALGQEAMQRGWECLQRYAQVLGDLPRDRVRAVATQTLREASNRDLFLSEGSRILGCPIEVIDGSEEARLIYRGVAQLLPPTHHRRLVVDIGGRSTELCLGQKLQVLQARSFAVGSLTWAQQYFADGELSALALGRAEQAVADLVGSHAQAFRAGQWRHAYGASGTAGAIVKVLAHATDQPKGWITRQGLDWLHAQLLHAGHVSRVNVGGLKEELRPMIGAGMSVMRALFSLLGIERMRVTHGALRHGVLYELADRWKRERCPA